MMQKIRDALERFMAGRYGMDNLNQFLLVVFFILFFVELFAGGTISAVCSWLSLFLLVLLYFRMFSRNQYARAEENLKYNQIKNRITGVFRRSGGSSQTDRDHKIFMCPQCGQKVRVPRGRGKVQIRCPKCGRQFIKRT